MGLRRGEACVHGADVALGVEGGSFHGPGGGAFSTWVQDPDQAAALADLATERGLTFTARSGRVDW